MHRINHSGAPETSSTDSWHLPHQYHSGNLYQSREHIQPLPPVSTILSSKPTWYTEDESSTAQSTPQSETYPSWRSPNTIFSIPTNAQSLQWILPPQQEKLSHHKGAPQSHELQGVQQGGHGCMNNACPNTQQNMLQAICVPYSALSQPGSIPQLASLAQYAPFPQHLGNTYNIQGQYVQLFALVGFPGSSHIHNNNNDTANTSPPHYSPERRSSGGISKHEPARFKSTTRNTDGKFPCPHCDKVYTNQKHWRRHNLRHTGERPYSCRLCSETFSRSDVLKRHVQKCSERHERKAKIEHVIHS